MIRIVVEEDLWTTAKVYLDRQPEQLGFFLADWNPLDRTFQVRDWQPFDNQTLGSNDTHVSLTDDVRSAVIRWAWTEGACLIEAHSHGGWSPAAFSDFDLANLDEWVPHLWWRLQGRPYAALVTSTKDFDGLAWTEGSDKTVQVDGVIAGEFHQATGATRSFEPKSHDGREAL
jgi:hypothetical protein